MYYVGADLHKEQTWFHVMDEQGVKVSSIRVPNEPKTLGAYVASLPQPFCIAVETTYNWYFFIDIVERYADKAYLANSYELKAFAKRNKKTDKIDARLIADVMRKGYLPTVTIADKNTRQIRELLRCRINIVKDRCRYIFRLKNLIDKLGEDSTGDFTSNKQLKEIKFSHLPEEYQRIITCYIEKIEDYHAQIYQLNKFIKETSAKDPDILNLVTTPGIDYFSAALIKTEIIDINRFASFNRLCSYAGLTPRVSQSADKTVYGPLNKNRRKYLQWILIETVYHFIILCQACFL